MRALRLAYRARLFTVAFARHEFDLAEAREWACAHGFRTDRLQTRPTHYVLFQGRLEEPRATFSIELVPGMLVLPLSLSTQATHLSRCWRGDTTSRPKNFGPRVSPVARRCWSRGPSRICWGMAPDLAGRGLVRCTPSERGQPFPDELEHPQLRRRGRSLGATGGPQERCGALAGALKPQSHRGQPPPRVGPVPERRRQIHVGRKCRTAIPRRRSAFVVQAQSASTSTLRPPMSNP
jgi:hypothetical protein